MKKIDIRFRKLGFGISLFGALAFTWIKYKWNTDYNCWAAKCCSFKKLFQSWEL